MEKKTLLIKTFTSEEFVQVDVLQSSQGLNIGNIKKAVCKKLELKPVSVRIFGIFLGPLGLPTKLFLETDSVCDTTSQELCFQRLCFNADEETRITRNDHRALELIFWEAKYMFDNLMIWPPPTVLQTINLNQLLTQGSKFSFTNHDLQRRFVEAVHTLSLFYYSCFYKATDCIHRVSTSATIGSGREVVLVLEFDKLIFIDKKTRKITSWPWNVVRHIRMLMEPKTLVKFQVLIFKDGNRMLRNLIVDTHRSEYIFTVAIHILKVHEARQAKYTAAVISWVSSFYEFNNFIFNSSPVGMKEEK